MRAYPWPASALRPEDMKVLHEVRERSRPRRPITELVARAVREAYVESKTADKNGGTE